MKPTLGLQYEHALERAIGTMLETRGMEGVWQRADEIAALPSVEWCGKTLRTIRCEGGFGKGPHDVNLPETLLFVLMDLRHYRCPFHS